MVRLLLDGGADASRLSNYGNTALNMAAAQGYTQVAASLTTWSAVDWLTHYLTASLPHSLPH